MLLENISSGEQMFSTREHKKFFRALRGLRLFSIDILDSARPCYDLVYAHCRLKFKTKWRMSVDKGDSLFTLICFSMSSIQNIG